MLPWCKPFVLSGLFPCTNGDQRRIKRSCFAANIYEKLGFSVVPNGSEPRQDIIQAVTLGTPEG